LTKDEIKAKWITVYKLVESGIVAASASGASGGGPNGGGGGAAATCAVTGTLCP